VTAALSLRGIFKRFDRVVALRDASLEVQPGKILALLGENGAGKTTLMRIAFGLIQPDAGEVAIAGRPVHLTSPAQAMALGVGMVHQHFALVPDLTAAENMSLGGRGWFNERAAADRLRDVAARAGLSVDPFARVEDMSTSAQQRLEIATALARGAKLLILDEPTAVLTPQESSELLQFLRRFADDGGAVVLITHKLREALGSADVVTVMRRGRTVLTAPRREVDQEAVAQAMLGEAPDAAHRRELLESPAQRAHAGERQPVVTARDLELPGPRGVPAVRGVTLTIYSGEIVGIAGVEGSGVAELVRALAGRLDPIAGELSLPSQIGFVPEDRLRDALIPEWSVTENVALRNAGSATGRIDWREFERTSASLLSDFDVRASSAHARVGTLSGGNQQKLVLARELAGDPALLVAEQPTRGLDVAASAAVHARLREARDRGAAVVVTAADLDELIMLADRLLVMFEGRAREVGLDRDAVGRAMLGLYEPENGAMIESNAK
jgi:simple sugar transport system ATP-binding protein